MNLTLSPIELPVRLVPPAPVSDEQLLQFCALNEGLRVERDAKGELIVMSAATSRTSGRNMDLSTELNNWARADGRGKAFDSSGGFTLPDGSMRNPDAAWILYSRWNALSEEEQDSFFAALSGFCNRTPLAERPSAGRSGKNDHVDRERGRGRMAGRSEA